MARILKYVLFALGGLVALLIVAAVSLTLLFEPNDFRDKIAESVAETTGRELTIEGDLAISLFPWLAIDVGRTRLGNAEGFGDEPFASFEGARLSVRLLPLLLRREISIGTAELDSLILNLAVKRNGRSNWQDLSERGAADGQAEVPADAGKGAAIDVASVALRNANIRYDDAQAGERYELTDVNFSTGTVAGGKPVDLSGSFGFRLQPADISGTVEIDGVVAFDRASAVVRFDDLSVEGATAGDAPMTFSLAAPAIVLQTEERVAEVGKIELSVLDVDIRADVAAFSYAGTLTPVATIQVDAFSPKSLMRRLNIEAPETADPNALGKLIVDAKAAVGENSIRLTGLDLTIDETRFTGTLTVPKNPRGRFELDVAGDRIDLDRYMAPAEEGGAGASSESVPVEIPVDIIRALNARGQLKMVSASLGGMQFEDVTVVLNSSKGTLRLNPLSAKFFDGAYQGDITINTAGKVPVLSVNERIQDVSLGALAEAMLERKNITGKINGAFKLEGSGNDMGQIQQTLKGNMSFVLSDGIWHGTDVWYELRRARALFRREEAPKRTLPAQTRFSEVSATGVVSDGVMRNDDFIAELPFMRLTGRGTVDFPTATVDYSLSGRVLEKPELASAATAEEIGDLTKAVIPIRISGPLAEPSFKIDFASLVRGRVEEEVKSRLLDKLLGGKDGKGGKDAGAAADAGAAQVPAEGKAEAPAEGEAEAPAEGKQEKQDPEDEIKDKLKELLKR